jgi:hypothetical protein
LILGKIGLLQRACLSHDHREICLDRSTYVKQQTTIVTQTNETTEPQSKLAPIKQTIAATDVIIYLRTKMLDGWETSNIGWFVERKSAYRA